MAKDKKLSKIKESTPVFHTRMATDKLEIGDATFEVRALPGRLASYLTTRAVRGGPGGAAEALVHYAQAALLSWDGVCTETGHSVKLRFEKWHILGTEFKVAKGESLDGLPQDTIENIAERALQLTQRTDAEDEAQDFTPATSPAENSTAPEVTAATAKVDD